VGGEDARRGQGRLRVRRLELRLHGGERGGVVRVGGERGAEPLRRGAPVPQPRLDAGRLEGGAGHLGGIGGGPRQLGQGARAAGRVARLPEGVGEAREQARARLRGRLGERLAQGRGGPRAVAEPLAEHLGPLGEERDPLAALRRGGARGEQVPRLGPALGGEGGAGHRGEDGGIARAQLEDAPELRGGLLEGSQVLLRHRGRAQPHRRLLIRLAVEARRRLGEQGEQLAVRAHLAGERLADAAGVGVLGAGAQRGGRVGERRPRVAQPVAADG
jgi:hypothetical protein